MSVWRWADSVRLLALLMAAFFFVAAVLNAVLAFNLTGDPPPEPPDVIDGIIANFTWEQSRWPIDFAGTLLAALGFLMFGAVGALLARLADVTDARRTVIAAAMVIGATLGMASQLLWIGVKPVAADPQFCDCGFRSEEIISRLNTLNIASSIQAWLNNGAIVALAIGVLLAVGLVRRAGISVGWVWLSYLLVIGAVLTPVLGELHAEPYDLISFLALVTLLIPGWALWLAIAAPNLAAPDTMPVEVPPEMPSVLGG